MNTFLDRYYKLEEDISSAYSELLKNRKEFIFLTEEDIENGDYENYFEARSQDNGNVYDIHIIKVDGIGIEVIEAEDDTKRYYVSFEDLADIQDRVVLIEIMQEYE
jgi:hypothetical protein